MVHHLQLQHQLLTLLLATPLHTIHLLLLSHLMVTHRPHQPTLFQHRLYLHVVALLLTGVCMTRDLPGVLLLITEVLHHQITEDLHHQITEDLHLTIEDHHRITVVHLQITEDHHLITVAIHLITIREDLPIIEDHLIIEFRQTTGAKAIIEDPLIIEDHQITEVLNRIITGLILLMGIEAEIRVLLIEVVAHHQEEVQGDHHHPIEDLHTVDLLVPEVVGGEETDIEL